MRELRAPEIKHKTSPASSGTAWPASISSMRRHDRACPYRVTARPSTRPSPVVLDCLRHRGTGFAGAGDDGAPPGAAEAGAPEARTLEARHRPAVRNSSRRSAGTSGTTRRKYCRGSGPTKRIGIARVACRGALRRDRRARQDHFGRRRNKTVRPCACLRFAATRPVQPTSMRRLRPSQARKQLDFQLGAPNLISFRGEGAER
jgi:hypothetical protein